MEKIDLSKLFTQKNKDYTYTIAFFLIFSFFLFFVIRPNILAIFQSNLKIANLTKTNAFYESQIENVIDSQTTLELVRNDLPLITEAITEAPKINQLINDFSSIASINNLVVDKITLTNVELKNITKTDQLKTIVFNVGLTGSFDNFTKMMKDFHEQLRLKTISNLTIAKKEAESTESGQLKINFQLESYYL